jgi:hypothetical protein
LRGLSVFRDDDGVHPFVMHARWSGARPAGAATVAAFVAFSRFEIGGARGPCRLNDQDRTGPAEDRRLNLGRTRSRMGNEQSQGRMFWHPPSSNDSNRDIWLELEPSVDGAVQLLPASQMAIVYAVRSLIACELAGCLGRLSELAHPRGMTPACFERQEPEWLRAVLAAELRGISPKRWAHAQ